MAENSFEQEFAKERERITKQRDEKRAEYARIASEIEQIDRQLAAIDAYTKAVSGTASAPASAKRGRRGGGKRTEILELIKRHRGGISRGEIIEKLGVKGDKSGEQSISNALTALKRDNIVTSSGGKYSAQ